MRRGGFQRSVCISLALCAAVGCSPPTTIDDTSGCTPGEVLRKATYNIESSKFAFGSKPVREDSNGLTRWQGSHGDMVIYANGSLTALLNAGAPEASLPTWSTDSDKLKAHTVEYFTGHGIEACQIKNQAVLASGICFGASDGSQESCMPLPSGIALSRGIEGIVVAESTASATFVSGDVTTNESMYWPEIPADVVRDALAWRDRLEDDAKLAEYKALLPANARGTGEVMIHHSGQYDETLRAVAVYEVSLTPPADTDPDTYYEVRDYDPQGAIVEGWASAAH